MATIYLKLSKTNINVGDTAANNNTKQSDRGTEESSSEIDLKKFKRPFHTNAHPEKSEILPTSLEKASQSVILKTPWVPAPGKCTNHTTISLNPLRNNNSSKENVKGTSSAVSVASSPRRKRLTRTHKTNKPNTAEKGQFPKNRIPSVKLRSRKDGKERPYSLRSKDSLIDVTACLNEKREQLMKIWQDNLPNSDTYLLNLLEKTNELAIEAVNDVGKLRSAIQSLQKKPSLTNADGAYLESMKNSVMAKLNTFEESNGEIQRLIGTSSTRPSNEDVRSLSKSSQASINIEEEEEEENKSSGRTRSASRTRSAPSESQTDVIFLKNKSPSFFEQGTDNDTNAVYESASASQSNSNTIVKSCDSSSQADFSHLNYLYNEQYVLPGVQESYSYNHRLNQANNKKDMISMSQDRIPRVVRFQDHNEESDKFYKEKFTELQRKLATQESEVSDLRTELRRIESQSGFQLRLLKTNINDKLEELEVIPELLQLTEHRIGGTLHSRMLMEQSLHEKDRDLNSARGDMKKTLSDLIDTKEKLKRSEMMNNSLGFQLQEIIRENDRLKLDQENVLKSHTSKMEEMNRENSNLRNQLDYAVKNQTSFLIDDAGMTKENIKLAEKILELEKNLAKAERDIRLQKKSKEKLSMRMNRRVEEMVETLEDSRRRNRHLIGQIQYIKTSYFKLFPVEIFPLKYRNNQYAENTEKYASQESPTKIDIRNNTLPTEIENLKNIQELQLQDRISESKYTANEKSEFAPNDSKLIRSPSADKVEPKIIEKKRVLFKSPTGNVSEDENSSDSDSDSNSYL